MEKRDKIYIDGYNAYLNGTNEEDCPYVKFTSNYTYWGDGYFDAKMTDIQSSPRGMFSDYEN